MKIVCVDDEPLILQGIVSMCMDIPSVTEVKGFTRGSERTAWLRNNEADIALLDIDMPETDGITLAMRLKENRPDIIIVFLTGYSQYAVDAFSMHAEGYLMKPVSKERLKKELEYQFERKSETTEHKKVFVRTFGNFDVF